MEGDESDLDQSVQPHRNQESSLEDGVSKLVSQTYHLSEAQPKDRILRVPSGVRYKQYA